MLTYLNWDDGQLGKWNDLDLVWVRVAIEEIVSESIRTGTSINYVLQKQPEETHKKFIKILLTVNSDKYTQEKYKKKIKIDVDDFKIIANKINVRIV